MENPEEILHSLEEFTKLKPKDIPRELEEYLSFVAKTGDPVYQWAVVKSLFKEKLISVITDFYESCPSVEVPPCPNVEVFNYEIMKSFILEKLDTFVAAPFTVQRICELLTTPRKEYNRIDKYMRALEKNILVVSTTEPLNRRAATVNAEGIVNGLESEHILDINNVHDINVVEIEDSGAWPSAASDPIIHLNKQHNLNADIEIDTGSQPEFIAVTRAEPIVSVESVITCRPSDSQPFVSIEPVVSDNCVREDNATKTDITVTITAIPAAVQKRRDSIEPIVSSVDEEMEIEVPVSKDDVEMTSPPPSSPSELIITHTANVEVLSIVETTEPMSVKKQVPAVTARCVSVVVAPEVTTSVVQTEDSSDVVTETTSSIQIPIISEITSDINTDLDAEASAQSPVSALQDDSNSDDSTILNEPSEVLEEVSTSTPEPASSTDSHSNFEAAEITKDTMVSSSDDLNSVVVESKSSLDDLDSEVVDTKDVQSFEEESSCESTDNTSEAEEKQPKPSPSSEIQEFASSSTITECISMEEETCQEAPTFNR